MTAESKRAAPPRAGAVGAAPLLHRVKRTIVNEVRTMFHDPAGGERPIQRRTDGLFGPHAIAWRVHGDVTTMLVGGVAALLLQMLHPVVLAGVWDHSNFRTDMAGRLRRTARFIAVTTYDGRTEAEAAIVRVRAIHARVRGVLPDGTTYTASDPRLLAWVHVTEAMGFLGAWIRYAEPDMPVADRDRYWTEMARIAEALGADPVPRSQADALHLVQSMRGDLISDARTREVARLVLQQPALHRPMQPLQAMTMQAAIDLLPDWARAMHGLPEASLWRPLIRLGTYGIAETLRWAFR